MLNFPLWKRLFVIGVCLIGLAVALPNLFYDRVERANDARLAIDRGAAETPELAADMAGWPAFLPSGLVNLGLDLRGGAHVLVEVRLADAQADRMEGLWPELRDKLRDLRDQVGAVRRLDGPPEELRIRIGEPSGMAAALAAVEEVVAAGVLARPAPRAATSSRAPRAPDVLVVTLSEAEIAAMDERTMQQSLEIIRRRVDETGTREPTIQRQGADRILIQVPGIGSAEELLAIIGQTARLSFHPVVSRTADPEARPGLDEMILPSADEPGVFYVLERRAVVTGDQLVDSQPSFDQNGQPAVNFRFNPQGGAAFGQYTADEHRQAVRDRARRRGDLGAGDPEPHRRRLRHHHRQLHARGVDPARDPAARRRAARPRSTCSSSARSARSSGRTRSRPAASRRSSRWRRSRPSRSRATASSASSPAWRYWST